MQSSGLLTLLGYIRTMCVWIQQCTKVILNLKPELGKEWHRTDKYGISCYALKGKSKANHKETIETMYYFSTRIDIM